MIVARKYGAHRVTVARAAQALDVGAIHAGEVVGGGVLLEGLVRRHVVEDKTLPAL